MALTRDPNPRDAPHLDRDGDRWRGRPSEARLAVTDDGPRSESRSSGGWQGGPSGDDIERGDSETRCQRCGRPNVWSWHTPSPLWNAVLRNPETGEDDWSILCPPCFADIAEAIGVVPSGYHTWHFAPEGIDIESLWTDRDGRVWDSKRCLWVEP